MWFHKLIATSLGIGYIGKGAGTVAAVFCCICWYLAWAGGYPVFYPLLATLLVTAVGIWSSGRVVPLWGKDPSRVVIDEVAGMCISLLFVPVNWKYVLAGLILFRFFDIVKPLFIRRMEAFKNGWGIMLDDILSGIYANLLLQVIIYFRIF